MADTPAETPKRRRTTKSPDAKPEARKPATRVKTAEAPKTVAAEKPKRTRKTPASAKSAAPEKTAPAAKSVKPRAPRKPKASAAAAAAPAPAPALSSNPTASAARRESGTDPAPQGLGWLAALGAAAAVGGAWFVWRSSRAEEPSFQLVEQDGAVEVRKYPSLVTAGTHSRGERQAAINEGFRTLADYLFAKSRPGPKLDMTAPVLADREDGGWRTRFVMPAGKARAQLPAAPDGVELTTEPAARFAAIRFSGRASDDVLDAKERELRSWLQTKGYPHEGRAVHAFYNAPFLPGPLRRNEVLVMLSNEGGTEGAN